MNHPEEVHKERDASFKVMWDIILQHLVQKRLLAVSHFCRIFFYCRSNQLPVFLCNLILVIGYKSLKHGGVAFWGQWQQKPGLSGWCEVGMGLMHECGHHKATAMGLFLPWRSGRGQEL